MFAKSLTTRTHNFLSLRLNIVAISKKFAKPFLPVHIWSKSNGLIKKTGQKSGDTVPLSMVRIILPTKLDSVAEQEPVEPKLFRDLEPELVPKLSF